jgi:hypothetical protein
MSKIKLSPLSSIVWILCLTCLGSFLQSCAAKKVATPQVVRVIETNKDLHSDIVLNYRFDKKGIRDTFNRAIAETFKTPFIIPDYDVKLSLSKPKEATVEIEGKKVLVVVPVGILVEKSTFLADLKAKGLLEMSFVTDVDMDSLWNFKSKTILVGQKWIETPKLSVGGLSLPIETISNAVISKTKASMESTIDQSVKESFTIKQVMTETMRMFDQPIKMNPELNGWLHIKPQRMYLTKVINNKSIASGKMSMKLYNNFSMSPPPAIMPKLPLPKLYWTENISDSSTLRLVADIKISEINQVLKSNFDGRTFAADDKNITLNNTITECDYDVITVNTDVSGSIDGKLVIKGRPIYDPLKNEFSIQIVDIGLKSKNIALKAIAWLAEGKIRKEIEKKLIFPINSYLGQAQTNINQQVAQFNKQYDLQMKLSLGSIDVENFELRPGQLSTVLRSKFYLDLYVKDLRSFGKF